MDVTSTTAEPVACPVCGRSVSFKVDEHVNSTDFVAEAFFAQQETEKETAQKTTTNFRASFFSRSQQSNRPVKIHFDKCSKLYKGLVTLNGAPIPVHKTVIGTDYVVDAFKAGPLDGCKGYFLSHFHSDHYDGLKSDWNAQASIFCSDTTAKLAMTRLKVRPEAIQILPMDEWVHLPGIRVLLVDANHCPGSVMFLFDINGKLVLHTGDCRAGLSLLSNPVLSKALTGKKLHTLYLDNTYCAPEHTFPCQSKVISECSSFARAVVEDKTQIRLSPIKRLILVGSYIIGKERIALALAKEINSLIYVAPWKKKVFQTFEWPELLDMLTDDPRQASVHIVAMATLSKENLCEYLDDYYPKDFTHILAIRPTGWTGTKPVAHVHDYKSKDANGLLRVRKEAITVHSVPYSEHSSFDELSALLATFPAEYIIPTVGNIGRDLYLRPESASPVETLLFWHRLTSKNT